VLIPDFCVESMKRHFMPAAALRMKKVALTILCCALLFALAASAWAQDPCTRSVLSTAMPDRTACRSELRAETSQRFVIQQISSDQTTARLARADVEMNRY
jgi:hypothetical protein